MADDTNQHVYETDPAFRAYLDKFFEKLGIDSKTVNRAAYDRVHSAAVNGFKNNVKIDDWGFGKGAFPVADPGFFKGASNTAADPGIFKGTPHTNIDPGFLGGAFPFGKDADFLAGLFGFDGNADKNKQTPFLPYLQPIQVNQKPNFNNMPFYINPLDTKQPGLSKLGETPNNGNFMDRFLDELKDPRGRNKYAPLPGAAGGNAGAPGVGTGFDIPGNGIIGQPDWQKEQEAAVAGNSQLGYSENQPSPANAGSFQGERHDTTAEEAERTLRMHISEGRYDLALSILGHSRGREALEAIGVDVARIAEEAEEEKRKQKQRDARFKQGLLGEQEGQEPPEGQEGKDGARQAGTGSPYEDIISQYVFAPVLEVRKGTSADLPVPGPTQPPVTRTDTERVPAGPEPGPAPQTTPVIPAQSEKTIDARSTTSQTPDKEEEPDTPMMHYYRSRGYNRKYTYSQMNEIMEEFERRQPKTDMFNPSKLAPTDEEFYAIGEELFGKPSYAPPVDILNMSADDYLDALENDDTKTTTAYIDAIRKGLKHQPYFSDTQRRRFTALMYDKAPPGGVELLAGLAGIANGSTLNLMDLFRSIGIGTNSEMDKQFWEGFDELRNRKPGAYSTGEALGQLIPMLVTGGLLKNPLSFIKNPYLNNAMLWGSSMGIPTLFSDINKGKPALEVLADTIKSFGTGAVGGIAFKGLADILPQMGTLEFQKLLDSGVSERLVYALARLAKLLNPKAAEAAGEAKGKYAESDFTDALAGKDKGRVEGTSSKPLAGNEGAGYSWYKSDGTLNLPPNNGAVIGTEKVIELQPGSKLGRFGGYGKYSDFVAAPGSSAEALSLPPYTDISIYQEFTVLKPIPGVTQSTVAPWGGSTGGGTQYKLPMTIEDLLLNGYICK